MKNGIVTMVIALLAYGVCAAKSENYSDVQYRSSGDQYTMSRCKLDVYRPDESVDRPVVVWFHGGSLTGGNKAIPEELKRAGVVVVAPEYRLLPNVEISACIDDAAAAVAWVFKEVEKYGGSRRKVFVTGHSAGGYLAAMIGLDKHWLASYGVDADSIAGLVPFSGQMISHFSYRRMHGIGDLQATVDEYAPLYHVRGDAAPMVLITGDAELELFGRYEENLYMWRMMRLVGAESTAIYRLDGYNHGDMPAPAFHILLDFIRRQTNL